MSLPPILTTTEEIAQLATRLSQHAVIAVDLEADSMHNYLEKVCLLQFSTPDETVLVDPLARCGVDAVKNRSLLTRPFARSFMPQIMISVAWHGISISRSVACSIP